MIDMEHHTPVDPDTISDDDAWFNGLSFIKDIKVRPVKSSISIGPAMSAVNESIPGKYGNFYEGINYESREISFQIFAKCGTDERLEQEIRENIAQAFIKFNPSNPTQEYELVFGNENVSGFGYHAHKHYIGHVTNIGAPQYLHDDGTRDFTCNITFECSDPRAYLPMHRVQGVFDSNDNAEVKINYNDGTAPAEFEAEVLYASGKAAHHVGFITDSGGVMAIGDDHSEVGGWSSSSGTSETNNLIPAKWDPTNLVDIANTVSGTLANWVTDQAVISQNFANIQWGHDSVGQTIGGAVTTEGTKITVGTRKVKGYKPSEYPKNKELKPTDGKSYSVQNYGTDEVMRRTNNGVPNGTPWYGPVIVSTGIIPADTSTTMNNFKITFRIHHTKYGNGHPHNARAMGDIEFLLLDASNNAFFRAGVKDSSTGEAPTLIMQFCKPGSAWSDKANVLTLVSDSKAALRGQTKRNDQIVRVPYKTKSITTIVRKIVSKTSRKSTSSTTRTSKTKRRGKSRAITSHSSSSTSTTTRAEKKTSYQYSYYTEKTKNEENAFTNGWIEVTLSREFGKFYIEAYKLDSNGNHMKGGWSFTKYKSTPVPNVPTGDVSLSRVACGFFKHSIMEDTVTPFEIYRSCSLSMTHCSIWAMNQEYYNRFAPRDIKHYPNVTVSRGDHVTFSSIETTVKKNGTAAQPSWGTNYPTLTPQKINTLHFKSDGDLTGATYKIEWAPRML
ncbi:hypothetical protein LOB97_00365 [Lactobacillus delbrueckii subsp. lactis]|uniref:Phage tail protein n=1 Tax=Lactobacillus delbrueckii subsp. lactis TaxID=29397 RepID=A0A3G6K4L5_LACDL|nr:hypothetical protein [Lactobacillus delbrueckii]AZA15985.1 MAG: hypothetical protein DQL93_05060 [Lactobacillus delbrueckii subsp. lactis]AZA25449.1 MAG: hypothetical protein DF199_06595 [Lactobacillus delbrueckii subsp. lactis]MCD5603308.1 hypothetical protein [Lactobacillus delbrueckii subsp. lactis]